MVRNRSAPPRTFREALKYFSIDANCRDLILHRRWPNGVHCPQCGSDVVYIDSSRKGWECSIRHPKRKFTLKTGTLFEDSPLELNKWLLCIWLVANSKRAVNSHDLARTLDVTQKTAWSMLHRIRLALD